MAIRQVSYSHARDNLAKILDHVENSLEPVIIKRRGHEDMALLPASELSALMAAAHLLRSPTTARRLLSALQRALEDFPESRAQSPQGHRKD